MAIAIKTVKQLDRVTTIPQTADLILNTTDGTTVRATVKDVLDTVAVDTATTTTNGISKPDDSTIGIDANGTLSVKKAYADSMEYDIELNELKLKSGNTVLSTVEITGGGGGVEIGDVTNVTHTSKHGQVSFTWTDPANIEVDGVTLARWDGTMVVRKAGSIPETQTDGTLVVNSKSKNAYASTAFVDSTVTDDVLYYYRFFPYTTAKTYTPSASFTETPARVAIAIPSTTSALIYDGTEQSPTWTNYDSTKMDKGGDEAGTNAGNYTTTFTLHDDYKWSDGTREVKSVTWRISSESVTVPTTSSVLTYTGSSQHPTWVYDSTKVTVTGDQDGINAGSYTTTFTLNSDSMQWSDGDTQPKNITWTIGRQNVTLPAQSGTLTYDTTEQTPTWSNYDSTKLTIGGDTEGTNAGTYTATFTPTANYQWSGGTYEAENVTWEIEQADGDATLSATSVTLDADHLSATVTVSDATGTVTISDTTSNTIATASLSGNTITITNVNETSGETTITVYIASSQNYKAATKTITVTGAFSYVVNFTWAGATDAQIMEAVTAADNGETDLTEAWAVGDERGISLAAMAATGVGESHVAQDVQFVLVAKDTGVASSANPCWNYQYVDTSKTRKWPSFIVQQKNVLSNGTSGEFGYMNSSNTNSGSWNGCARKTWCDNIYYPAILGSSTSANRNTNFKNVFKQVKVKTIDVYNGTSMQSSNCYFFLPAAAEVFKGDGSYGQGGTAGAQTAYSNLTEFNALSRWDYYATTSNRVKYQGASGSAYYWWERSPFYNNATYFGGANYHYASYTYGLAPAACL